MRVASPRVAFTWTISLCCLGCACVTSKMPDSAQVSAAMADRFESVFFANADFVAGRGGYGALSEQDASALRIPFADLLHALESLRVGTSTELMSGARAVWVGGGTFSPPRGPPPRLGGARSRYCYVVALGARGDGHLGKYAIDPPAGEMAGRDIWQWTAAIQEGEEHPTRIYAVLLAPGYLLVGNSLPDVRAVGEALLSRGGARFDSLPQALVTNRGEVVGLRRPRRASGSAREPALPAETTSLMFIVTPKTGTGVLRVESEEAGRGTPEMGAHVPALKKTGPKTWETTLSFKGDEATLEATLSVLGHLGFGIYL